MERLKRGDNLKCTTYFNATTVWLLFKSNPELLQGLNDRVADKLGLPIETSANSVFGQIHGVYAFALSEMWEELEKLYFSMFPSTAEGVSLSHSAELAGIAQIDSEPTNLIATCYGVEGGSVTLHPVGILQTRLKS